MGQVETSYLSPPDPANKRKIRKIDILLCRERIDEVMLWVPTFHAQLVLYDLLPCLDAYVSGSGSGFGSTRDTDRGIRGGPRIVFSHLAIYCSKVASNRKTIKIIKIHIKRERCNRRPFGKKSSTLRILILPSARLAIRISSRPSPFISPAAMALPG